MSVRDSAGPSPTREKCSGYVPPRAECTRGGKLRALAGRGGADVSSPERYFRI